MRPVLVVGLIALAVAGVVGVSEWRSAHAHELIPWRTDLATAQQEARAQHKPVFAYFTASWCPPCQKMKSTTWADNAVNDAMSKYVPVKIDIDADRADAERFGINSIPAYRVLSEDAQLLRSREGRMYPEEMVAWLEK
jgi:thiol:disulfide interchange protein